MGVPVGQLLMRVGADLSAFTAGMKGMQQQAQEASGKVVGTLNSISSAASRIFGALGFAGVGAAMYAAARNFDEAAVQIQRSTGATGAKLDALKTSFKNIYTQVDESSQEVASTMALLSTRTNAQGKDLEKLTVAMLNLAETQGESATNITPLVTRAFGDWNIATGNQARSLDMLRVVSQQSGVGIGRLTEQLVYAGAPLRQLGYSFDEAAVLVAKFEKEGVNTQLVLGGMKKAAAEFSKQGLDPEKAWQQLIQDVREGKKSFEDVIKLVGIRPAVDLFRAIQEGRFEIQKTTAAAQELAAKGGDSVDTFGEKLSVLRHKIEAVFSSHTEGIQTASIAFVAFGPIAWNVLDKLRIAVINIASALRYDMVEALTVFQKALLGGAIAAPFILLGEVLDQATEKAQTLRTILQHLPLGPTTAYMAAKEGWRTWQSRENNALTPEELAPKHSLYAPPAPPGAFVPSSAVPGGDAVAGLTKVNQELKKIEVFPWEELSLKNQIIAEKVRLQANAWADVVKGAAQFESLNSSGKLFEGIPEIAPQVRDLASELEDLLDPGKKSRDAMQALNVELEKDAAAKAAKSISDQWTPALKTAQREMSEFEKDAHRAWNQMTNHIARNIVEWKGWKDTVISVGKDFATGFLSIMLKQLLEPLEASFAKVAGKIGGWLSGVLGGGGGAASGAIGAAGSAAGGAASAAGGASSGAGGAASGAMGAALGWANLGVGIASGIASGIQQAHTNTLLTRIEESTRYVKIATTDGADSISQRMKEAAMRLATIESQIWDAIMPAFAELIWTCDYGLQQVVSAVRGGLPIPAAPQLATAAATAGGEVFEFNNCTFNGVTQDLVREVFTSGVRRIRQADHRRRF